MLLGGIDNIGIACRQLDRSLAFYARLGFSEEYRADGAYRACKISNGEVAIFLFESQAEEGAQPREFELVKNPPGIDHLSFRVGNVDEVYQTLKSRGVAFTWPPADQPWGARVATLKDPDGVNIWLLQWPAS